MDLLSNEKDAAGSSDIKRTISKLLNTFGAVDRKFKFTKNQILYEKLLIKLELAGQQTKKFSNLSNFAPDLRSLKSK